MRNKTAHLDIRVEPMLVARIDDWRDTQRIPPTRSAAIVHMIEEFLERELGDARIGSKAWVKSYFDKSRQSGR